MEMFLLYVALQADGVLAASELIIVCMLMVIIPSGIAASGFKLSADDYSDAGELSAYFLRAFKCSLWALIAATLVQVFLPSTNSILVLLGVHTVLDTVSNNSQVQESLGILPELLSEHLKAVLEEVNNR